VRNFDWASTPLGPLGEWPGSLRVLVDMLLSFPSPMILLWGEDLIQIYNDAYRDLMGRKHPGGLGQRNRECWPEAWAFTGPVYESVLRQGETREFVDQALVLQRHGQAEEGFFTLSYSPVRREDGQIGGVLVAVTETTGRVLAERHLEAQNAELAVRARALEGFGDLVRDLSLHAETHDLVRRAQELALSLLPAGYTLYYEREGERWHNTVQTGDVGNAELQAFIDAGPPVGQTPSIDLPWTTHQPLYQDVYAKGSDTDAAIVQHVNAAATLPVLVRGVPVGVFVVCVFEARGWNGTEKALLETTVRSLGLTLEGARGVRELTQRTRELERSNAELEQFAYIASHDLQAPIRAVTSFSDLLRRRYAGVLDERGQLYLHQIMESGQHMKQLVDDLLSFSRVRTQQQELAPVDAGEVLARVIGRLEADIRDAGGEVQAEELPCVLADAQQLDGLFQNLISNGLKYRREGVSARVHVSAQREGEMWRFAVGDNGIGIEPQYFERIFVIFQRLHVRERYEGTGIGLAVCKKIVERHGGKLWLESSPGEGSTFFFTLPACPPEADAEPRPPGL